MADTKACSHHRCAGCNINNRSQRMQHHRPIPRHCVMNLPYRSSINARMCQACVKKNQRRILQGREHAVHDAGFLLSASFAPVAPSPLSVSATSTTVFSCSVPSSSSSSQSFSFSRCSSISSGASSSSALVSPNPPLLNSSIASNEVPRDTRYQLLMDAVTLHDALDTSNDGASIPNLRYSSDLYSLFLPGHLQLIHKISSVYDRLCYNLQTSRVDDSDAIPPMTSTTNAEIQQKGVLHILTYFIYLAPSSLRLNPLCDAFMDIGSGYGYVLLMAYLGLGIENVCGVELVPQRYAASLQNLCRIFEQFQLLPSSVETGSTGSNEQCTPKRSSRNRKQLPDDASSSSSSENRSSLETVILPAGFRLYAGDVNEYLEDPEQEVGHRLHACSHFCLFDLQFSKESLTRLARSLSNPTPTTRWRMFMSMKRPQVWYSYGLVGWSSLGKLSGITFKGGNQSATVYFYGRDTNEVSRLPPIESDQMFLLPPLVKLQLSLLIK